MNIKKKFTFLFASISLLLCFFVIQDTYAKYITSSTGSAEMKIARWKILVNDKDITDNSSISNLVTPVFNGNANIASDVIAPTATGYFDLIIDANNTDVSFRYEISVDVLSSSSVYDLVVTGYSLNGGETININNDSVITNSISLNDVKYNTIRIFIKWHDGAGETMNNTDDTNAATGADPKAKLRVNLSFTQIPSV